MTPDELLLRDAFLSELWPVVREWHPGDDHPPVRTARKRRCPHCGLLYGPTYIDRHVRAAHQRGQVA